MPAQWTADIIGKMHLYHITSKELAEFLQYNPKYVSAILNGKRTPKHAESTFVEALEKLIVLKREKGE